MGAGEQHWGINLLFVGFGLASWVAINGIYSELPVIVNDIPEGWGIGADISIAIQAANILPLLYYLYHRHCQRRKQQQRRRGLSIAILSILLVGLFSAVGIAQTWQKTIPLRPHCHAPPINATAAGIASTTGAGGDDNPCQESSFWFLLFSFTSAVADSMSSVTFFPFVATFTGHNFIPALMAGESLTGFVPSALTWAQTGAVGGSKRNFSPLVFFYLLAAQMLLSTICFSILLYLRPRFNQEPLARPVQAEGQHYSGSASLVSSVTHLRHQNHDSADLGKDGDEDDAISDDAALLSTRPPATALASGNEMAQQSASFTTFPRAWVRRNLAALVKIGTLSCWLNSIFTSVLSYATIPYGSSVYHIAQTISLCAQPVGAITAGVVVARGYRTMSPNSWKLAAVWMTLSTTILAFGIMSPNPPLKHKDGAGNSIGGSVIATVLAFACFLLSFDKTYTLSQLLDQPEVAHPVARARSNLVPRLSRTKRSSKRQRGSTMPDHIPLLTGEANDDGDDNDDDGSAGLGFLPNQHVLVVAHSDELPTPAAPTQHHSTFTTSSSEESRLVLDSSAEGPRMTRMFWCGVAIQSFSLVSSVIMFVLTHYTTVFRSG